MEKYPKVINVRHIDVAPVSTISRLGFETVLIHIFSKNNGKDKGFYYNFLIYRYLSLIKKHENNFIAKI